MRFMQSRHSSSCFISLHWPHLKDRKTYILKVNCWYLLLSLTFVIVVKIWIFCILYILLWVKRNDEIKRSHDMTISMLFIIEKWKIIIQVWYWLFSCKLLCFFDFVLRFVFTSFTLKLQQKFMFWITS